MRAQFEFLLHTIAPSQAPAVEPNLAMLGSQGWELRGICALHDGSIVVALQRPLDEEAPLPGHAALAATLEAPLVAPGSEELSDQHRN